MRLMELYNSKIVPELVKMFGYKNKMQAPRLEKVVLNVGINSKLKDTDISSAMENTLRKISGQKPIQRLAKKSISSFKIRKGMAVGVSVTLRGRRMYDFVERFVRATLPRVRDFRGIPSKSFDGHGNYSFGLREQTPFPELKPQDLDKLHGLEIVFVTTAKTDKEARGLLELMGFPFMKS